MTALAGIISDENLPEVLTAVGAVIAAIGGITLWRMK